MNSTKEVRAGQVENCAWKRKWNGTERERKRDIMLQHQTEGMDSRGSVAAGKVKKERNK